MQLYDNRWNRIKVTEKEEVNIINFKLYFQTNSISELGIHVYGVVDISQKIPSV